MLPHEANSTGCDRPHTKHDKMSFIRATVRTLAPLNARFQLARDVSGTVRSFNIARGFGFIVPDEGARDGVFFFDSRTASP